jgi:fumarylpyruvate hydrolase
MQTSVAAGLDRGLRGIIAHADATPTEPAMSFVITPPAPVSVPVLGGGLYPVRRVYCVGRNYAEHAQEMGFTGREPPFFFLKPADAIVYAPAGETGQIDYPTLTSNFHHEIELVAAVGTGGKNILAADAAKHIYGYAVGLDMTRRDLQGDMKKQGRPWCIGKGFDQSAPIGPIVPKAQTGELTSGPISLSVNGAVKQKGDLKELIWSVNETIEVISQAWELQPGDLIFTGTPAGVGAVVRGDLMEGHVHGLPSLKVQVR